MVPARLPRVTGQRSWVNYEAEPEKPPERGSTGRAGSSHTIGPTAVDRLISSERA